MSDVEEARPLLSSRREEVPPTGSDLDFPPSRRWIWRVTVVVAVGVTCALGFLSVATTSPATTLLSSTAAAYSSSLATIEVRLTDKYTSKAGVRPASDFLPWRHVAAAYEPTTLDATCEDCGAVEFTFEGGDSISASSSSTAEVTFKTVGEHLVRVKALDASTGEVVAEDSIQVMVKYVRRELRSLSEKDRERFLAVLHTVYTMPTEEGVVLYGERYRGIEHFVRKHLYGAASKECDHWHDDAGIMTHHMAFTLELEQSLQAVDPAVSVAYWDYTVDDVVYCQGSESSNCWRDIVMLQSPVFRDDWFGAASPPNRGHYVMEGLWADVTVMKDASSYSSLTNSYGLLRSPWNTNPVARFTRHYQVLGGNWESMVGCSIWAS